jgi:hypothetical protein
MTSLNAITGKTRPSTAEEKTQRDVEEAAWAADTPRREAQAILEQYDVKGYTRAWESAVAPNEATLGEFDKDVLAQKRAARAVVVGQ